MTEAQPTPVPIPVFDMAKWEADRAREAQIDAEILPKNKAALFDALSEAGIATVTAVFDGYGDSGQIEDIEAKTSDDIVVELPSKKIEFASVEWGAEDSTGRSLTVRDAIDHMVFAFLSGTHCGWENNDGAYGEFVFDVAERTITLDYNERFTSSESYSHEW